MFQFMFMVQLFIQELWERKSLQILYECRRRAYHALLAQLFIMFGIDSHRCLLIMWMLVLYLNIAEILLTWRSTTVNPSIKSTVYCQRPILACYFYQLHIFNVSFISAMKQDVIVWFFSIFFYILYTSRFDWQRHWLSSDA